MNHRELQPKSILNKRYEIIEYLGRGGMGHVVKARRLHDGLIVAVKYCLLRDPKARRRFGREVRTMQAISSPYVMPVLAKALKRDPPYFVMPLATGSLRGQIDECMQNEDLALGLFLQACDGIAAVHAGGAIHRDIKPDNFLILKGRVVVSDLGLAKFAKRDSTVLTQTRVFLGTEAYKAPEQSLPGGCRNADARTDVCQLGKTLYELLTGERPILMDLSKLTAGLGFVVRRATTIRPDDRFQTVGALIDALKGYQRSKDPKANPLGAFEAALSRTSDRAKHGGYRQADVQELFNALTSPLIAPDKDQFLDLFFKIPAKVLVVAAEVCEDYLQAVLRTLVEAVDAVVGGKSFSFGETVGEAMQPIFASQHATSTIKSLALEAVLIAGVRLNRYRALEIFDQMLEAVKDDDDAFEVAEMLERRRHEYAQVQHRVTPAKLNPIIRAVQAKLSSESET